VLFEALWAERHVGRAAQRMNLSQSATSHALSRLRDLLGDELFIRHPKGVEPTARARELAEPVDRALAQIRTIMARPGPFDPAQLRRTFKLGATDYAVFVVLAPLIAHLQREAPFVDLQITPIDQGSVVGLLDRGEIDLALGNFPDLPVRLESLALFAERFVGVLRRGHPALGRDGMSLDDFVRVPHALVSLRGDPHGRVDEALERLGRSRRVAVTVAHFLSLPFVIGASDMIGVLAERAGVRMAETTGLALFQLPVEMPAWTLHLARPRQLAQERELAWLFDLIATQSGAR
jgi:DNA-binding transcriptional LysR family regulator